MDVEEELDFNITLKDKKTYEIICKDFADEPDFNRTEKNKNDCKK